VEQLRTRSARALVTATVTAAALLATVSASAQVPPVLGGSTTTTAAPTTTAPAAQPSGDQLASGAEPAPPGAQDAGGDGAPAPSGGIAVPPEAQRIIDAVHRTPPSNDSALLGMLDQLRALGLSDADAYRVGMGRFPVAGAAHYGHDWLYPRHGPGFRFHLGTDVFAAYGTPLRAPVAGIAKSANGGLGGLTVKVIMPDGTYFYLAHMSRLAEGFVDGMPVSTGDIVGYVGDSGNARGGAPHVHVGVYPHGGPAVDPKPILDSFLAEAVARMPDVVAALRASQPPAAPPAEAPSTAARALRPMLATGILHPLAAGGADIPAPVLYLVGSDVLNGGRALVELALADLVDSLGWATPPP
jgi:murein DD-endopeptidase MepM/ murein hydrolase activator NlpD